MALKTIVQLYPMFTVMSTAVLALLLIILAFLTVKIYTQNDELQLNLDKMKRDKYVLDKMCMDYTVAYYIELNSGNFEIFKKADESNINRECTAKKDKSEFFDDYIREYSKYYIADENREEFINWFSCENLKKQLTDNDRASYDFMSVPNAKGKRFFAAQAIKVYSDDTKFYILLGVRYIDDIIEKEKEAQDKLQQALDQAKLENEIISAISKNYCAIYRIDLNKDYFEEISNDDEFHRLTGNNGCASEKLYKICDTLVAPEYRETLRPFLNISTVAERLKNEEYLETEYKMCDNNWHRMRFIVKNRDDSGRVTHVLCTARSISDTKRREQDLHFVAEAAKREAEMKSRFLATMSHDIRTPINGIIGMIDMSEQYINDPEMLYSIRKKVRESLNYLVSLVNDILDLNKLQTEDLNSHDMTFDIAETMHRLNVLYAQKAEEKGIKYKVDWNRANIKHPYLIGNPVYLGRIVSNIADNAIKFSQPDTTITVWGKEESYDEDTSLFAFYCKDQGEGMSEDFVKHAFDMFSQGNDTSRSKYEGSGLGLAIVKQLADRMNGSVELESEIGVGTTAIIKLPFKIGKQEDANIIMSENDDFGNVSVKGIRALVAEDNELNMEIAKNMLELNGLEVTCAADGQEAVEIFKNSAPGYFGAIFMDIMMPNMDGLEAARSIRSMKRRDAGVIPIIAMSANSFSDDIVESRLAGMNYHLSKPMDSTKMINALKQCMALDYKMRLREDL